jgi:hypothetical protein
MHMGDRAMRITVRALALMTSLVTIPAAAGTAVVFFSQPAASSCTNRDAARGPSGHDRAQGAGLAQFTQPPADAACRLQTPPPAPVGRRLAIASVGPDVSSEPGGVASRPGGTIAWRIVASAATRVRRDHPSRGSAPRLLEKQFAPHAGAKGGLAESRAGGGACRQSTARAVRAVAPRIGEPPRPFHSARICREDNVRASRSAACDP